MKIISTIISGNKNNGKQILFLILTAVIALITITSALKGQTTFDSEQYGTTSDYDLFLQRDQELWTEFSIRDKGFQGINIKLADQANRCGGDILVFTLVDQETGSVIARHELELRKTLPQIDVFIPLPYEESEGKTVAVHVEGKNLSKNPGLKISRNADLDSVLYKGNIEKRNRHLVFSAVYKTRKLISMQAVIKGFLYFFLLVLIFCWPWAFQRADRDRIKTGRMEKSPVQRPVSGTLDEKAVSKGAAASKRNVSKIKIPRRYAVIFAALTILYSFISVFAYSKCISQYSDISETTWIVERFDRESEESLDIVSDEDVLEQYFTADQNSLTSVSFDLSVPKADSKAKLHVQILDRFGNVSFYDRYVLVRDLPSERGMWTISLDHEEKESKDKEYLIRLTPMYFQDTQICLYSGEPREKTSPCLGGTLQGSYPILQAAYSEYSFLKTEFIFLSTAVYVFLLAGCMFLASKKHTVQDMYIPVCLFLGILYMLVIPVYSVPDEYAHIDTAYSLSNRMLGIEKPEDLNGYDYRRECDIETEQYLEYFTSLDDYRRYSDHLFTAPEEESLSLCVMRSSAANVNQLFFLPAAVGITIGRLLHLSTLPLYILGRFCNLLAYAVLTYLGIRKLPAMKEAYFIYATLPISLQQAASFSYDCLMNALALLFSAYCLYIAWKKTPVTRTDSAILLFTLLQMGSVKGGVYLPICLLMFLIPLERGWKWKKSIGLIAATGFCICVGFMQDNISRLLTSFLSGSKTRISPFAGKEMFTFGYLLHHPMQMIMMYTDTVFSEGSRMVYEFFGGKMGSIFDIQLPWMYVIVFLAILVLAINHDKSTAAPTMISRVLCAAVSVLVLLLVGFAMLLADTPKTSSFILGLQGRYFLPSVFLFFYMFIQMRTDKGTGNFQSRMLCYFITHCLFILNIVMIVIPKLVME